MRDGGAAAASADGNEEDELEIAELAAAAAAAAAATAARESGTRFSSVVARTMLCCMRIIRDFLIWWRREKMQTQSQMKNATSDTAVNSKGEARTWGSDRDFFKCCSNISRRRRPREINARATACVKRRCEKQ